METLIPLSYPRFDLNKWYHVAAVYDQSSGSDDIC